jgi:peptidoglycan/LPS O-acetylase OafA/YrhL
MPSGHAASPDPSAGEAVYLPQLDSLRAFAVLAVLFSHLTQSSLTTWVWWPAGVSGVRLFFTLSGFLITGILLRGRRSIRGGSQALGPFLRAFYARRMLRLYPLLLAGLAVAVTLHLGDLRHTVGWHALYLSNFYMYAVGRWDGSAAHLWSLSVEEQFYLVWPWLILLLPRRALGPATVAAIIAAPVLRTAVWLHSAWPEGVEILPFSALDNLGVGALLALAAEARGLRAVASGWTIRAALPLGIVILGVLLAAGPSELLPGWSYPMFLDFGLALISVWLVARAALGFRGRVGRLMESRPLVYLGTISYGIYLNHLFLIEAAGRVVGRMGIPDLWHLTRGRFPKLDALLFVVSTSALSIALASLTWQGYERPILRLKRHFPYRPRRSTMLRINLLPAVAR